MFAILTMNDNPQNRLGYVRYSLVTWVDRSATTNDNSTNMDADKKIHYYKNGISGIIAPFYCNIVSNSMEKTAES